MTKSARDAAARLNDNSEITIPLRNLISMIVVTAVSVWVYFGLTERITFLEHNLEMLTIEVEENDQWIEDWESSGELPIDKIQNFKIQELERQIR